MESALTTIKSLAKNFRNLSVSEKEKFMAAIEALEKEIDEKDFIMKRLEKR
jgi:hypothetical protein